MEVLRGEVHALVGENGAGKSTLIKIISGAETADAGEILIEGVPADIKSPADAMDVGIATVYQETQLFPELTVAENIFIGREIKVGGRIDWATQNREVAELLERLELPRSYATKKVGSLTAAQQQQVSIAKALSHSAKLLILDEPSAILADAEIQTLFRTVHRLTAEGVSVIYITHRLDELAQIANRVTVMRDGHTIGTYDISDISVRDIVDMMVGGEFSERHGRSVPADAQERLRLENLSSRKSFHDVDLTVRSGEVLVLYGLVGSGANEVPSAVYGMIPVDSGEVFIDKERVDIASASAARATGMTLLPANRKSEGAFSFQSLAFNMSIGNLNFFQRALGFVNVGKEAKTSAELIKRLQIKAPSADVALSTLSGGNAQKVVLARQIVEQPRILLLCEPTQGVDIGAKEEIHRLIDEFASSGTAILLSTTDLGEAIRIADRIVVMRAGKPFAEFPAGATQAQVLAAAAGELEEGSSEGEGKANESE